MKNLPGLFEAICSTYDRTDLHPLPNGDTFCNVAAESIMNMLGCHDTDGMTADEMVAFFKKSPDWVLVGDMSVAQGMANEGSLLIAGLDSHALKQMHGHVCVIRPGLLCYSGKWGQTARCLNVGQEMFLARAKKGPLTGMAAGLNEAFVPRPSIWVWKLSQ